MAGLALVGDCRLIVERHVQELEADGQIGEVELAEVRRLWRRRSSHEVDEAGREVGDVNAVERFAATTNRHL